MSGGIWLWDHPFKTSAFLRGEGVKNWPNLTTDSSKKLPAEGEGVKNRENLPTSEKDGPCEELETTATFQNPLSIAASISEM